MTTKFPGLIDPHVHVREPGATHKEDWDSCTQAALAGGFTQILAMPNTNPPITSQKTLDIATNAAKSKARIDYAQFLGAAQDNARGTKKLAPQTAGLKMYLDQTYGPLCLEDMSIWQDHFKNWQGNYPIAVHAERRTLAAVLLLSALYDQQVHICHVSRREEILLLKTAKEKGVKVTCEVSPHHLFLTENDVTKEKPGRGEVRPRLASARDRDALWENLQVIDCFASDHAPHTLVEKDGEDPPPGFPGLDTALYLYLTAVAERRLTDDDLIQRMHTNPRKIFKLPKQLDTWIEIDRAARWEIQADKIFSRCGWTPFEGWNVRGRLKQVHLRGATAFKNGEVIAKPGFGKNMRKEEVIG